jgi:tetratricopeptide (TPR) repeat protein
LNRNERRRLAKTSPTTATAALSQALNQAFARHQAGDLAGAEAQYRKILAANPDDPDALRMLGEVLIDRGKSDEAIRLLSRLVARHPDDFRAHYALGNAHRLAGNAPEAMPHYRAALARAPDFAGASHGLGVALLTAGQDAEAATNFAAAAKAAPRWALAWSDLGTTLASLGRFDEAAAALQEALRLDPYLGEARRHLTALDKDNSGIPALKALVSDPRTPAPARIEAGFALGKLLDRAGQYDDAFASFAAANALLRASQAAAGRGFDKERLHRDVGRLITALTQAHFAKAADWGSASALPVFIVGMPRAGTTLVEQILASHSGVFGAGELTGIGKIAGAIGWGPSPAWSQNAIAEAAGGHLASLEVLAPSRSRIIDKMPDNIFQLGLIATLFPNARIIFCARDPLDTCFSCFTQRFAQPHGFDNDLADCGFRYLQVQRLTRHWQAVLPLRHISIGYEQLIGDIETQSRRLVAFLGLDWEPACLEFHRTERTVKTASWAQVRRPAYRDSVGRAAHYLPHLAPLIAALAQDEPPENLQMNPRLTK